QKSTQSSLALAAATKTLLQKIWQNLPKKQTELKKLKLKSLLLRLKSLLPKRKSLLPRLRASKRKSTQSKKRLLSKSEPKKSRCLQKHTASDSQQRKFPRLQSPRNQPRFFSLLLLT